MVGGAIAGVADADRARLGAAFRHDALHVGEAAVGPRHHQRRHGREDADRRELGQHLLLAGEDRRHVAHGEACHDEGVAIGRRVVGKLEPDHAARPGLVVDQDALSKLTSHWLGHDARGDVVIAAGRERNDESNRMRREILRPDGRCGQCAGAQ